MAESRVPGNKSKGPKELGEEDMGWEPGHVVSEKKAKLMKNQEKILQDYMKSGGKEMFYDDLPESVKAKLRRVKDQETLDSDVDRFLNDNRKFASDLLDHLEDGDGVLPDLGQEDEAVDLETSTLAKLKALVVVAGGIAMDLDLLTPNVRVLTLLNQQLPKVNLALTKKVMKNPKARTKALVIGRRLNAILKVGGGSFEDLTEEEKEKAVESLLAKLKIVMSLAGVTVLEMVGLNGEDMVYSTLLSRLYRLLEHVKRLLMQHPKARQNALSMYPRVQQIMSRLASDVKLEEPSSNPEVGMTWFDLMDEYKSQLKALLIKSIELSDILASVKTDGIQDRDYEVIKDRLTKIKVMVFRKMNPSARSQSLKWERRIDQGLRTASQVKVAHRPILFREGLTASKVKSGEAFMTYKIDKGANNSKFYEGLILPMSDGQYVLKRRWGRLTDSGSTGRVDSRDEFFSSLDSAKSSLRDHYMKRLAHGYVDTFGPKHIDPATGAKLKQGEYPIGLGGAGFGWGGQQMVNQVGTLKTLRKYISDSMENFTEPRWRFQALADLDIVDRELGELGESSMAKKLRDYFKKARSIITKATDPAGVAQARKALVMIDKYVAKQMAHL